MKGFKIQKIEAQTLLPPDRQFVGMRKNKSNLDLAESMSPAHSRVSSLGSTRKTFQITKSTFFSNNQQRPENQTMADESQIQYERAKQKFKFKSGDFSKTIGVGKFFQDDRKLIAPSTGYQTTRDQTDTSRTQMANWVQKSKYTHSVQEPLAKDESFYIEGDINQEVFENNYVMQNNIKSLKSIDEIDDSLEKQNSRLQNLGTTNSQNQTQFGNLMGSQTQLPNFRSVAHITMDIKQKYDKRYEDMKNALFGSFIDRDQTLQDVLEYIVENVHSLIQNKNEKAAQIILEKLISQNQTLINLIPFDRVTVQDYTIEHIQKQFVNYYLKISNQMDQSSQIRQGKLDRSTKLILWDFNQKLEDLNIQCFNEHVKDLKSKMIELQTNVYSNYKILTIFDLFSLFTVKEHHLNGLYVKKQKQNEYFELAQFKKNQYQTNIESLVSDLDVKTKQFQYKNGDINFLKYSTRRNASNIDKLVTSLIDLKSQIK